MVLFKKKNINSNTIDLMRNKDCYIKKNIVYFY